MVYIVLNFPNQWIQQSTQTSIGDFSDVGVVEGADEPEHDQVHSQNQQNSIANSEIISSLQMKQALVGLHSFISLIHSLSICFIQLLLGPIFILSSLQYWSIYIQMHLHFFHYLFPFLILFCNSSSSYFYWTLALQHILKEEATLSLTAQNEQIKPLNLVIVKECILEHSVEDCIPNPVSNTGFARNYLNVAGYAVQSKVCEKTRTKHVFLNRTAAADNFNIQLIFRTFSPFFLKNP